uniref:DUF4283 domain-containing protein n=1 Tax=Tanacetum cinerariifolium TaxID=118510 RepID=A0A6L2MND2_TANCI|nr:hypothetical protein [Tanacetum cinerariifolium]GEY55813.1 hypothetical protein [Tanacetum cinerariifolium]
MTGVYDLRLKAGFLDSGGGGGKKKKNNTDVSLESVVGSGFLLLVDDTCIVHIQKGGSSSMGQVPDVNTINIRNDPSNIGACYLTSTHGMSNFYANVTGKSSRKSVNFRTYLHRWVMGLMWLYRWSLLGRLANSLLIQHMVSSWERGWPTPSLLNMLGTLGANISWLNQCLIRLSEDVGNVPVWVKLYGVPVTAFSEDGMSSYDREIIELRADVELKDTIMVFMPKLSREGQRFYTYTIRVEYDSKPPRWCHDSDDEVESANNDMARFQASEMVGFGTNSMLEQWSDTYENFDYDYDPYDDDMYEGQEIPEKIQSICDNLDIKVRGRKKK